MEPTAAKPWPLFSKPKVAIRAGKAGVVEAAVAVEIAVAVDAANATVKVIHRSIHIIIISSSSIISSIISSIKCSSRARAAHRSIRISNHSSNISRSSSSISLSNVTCFYRNSESGRSKGYTWYAIIIGVDTEFEEGMRGPPS